MNELKIAMIGCGEIAKAHALAYQNLMREHYPVRVAAVCDTRRDAALSIAGDAQTFCDWREMLVKVKPDIVDICLPTALHASVSIACLRAGCHVLCEKPMALCADDCQKMALTAAQFQRALMIGHVLRFSRPVEAIQALQASNRYGALKSGLFTRIDKRPDRMNGWILDDEQSGGVILDLQIHDIDTIINLFGTPEHIDASMQGTPDNRIVTSVFRYADGRIAISRAGWLAYENRHLSRCMRLDFENGYAFFDLERNTYTEVGANGIDRIENDWTEMEGVEREIRYFVDCIARGVPTARCLPNHALNTVDVALRCAMLVNSASANECAC